MMYSRSPGSFREDRVSTGKSTGCSCFVSAAIALGSTPWKIPALARISSTLPLQLSDEVIRAHQPFANEKSLEVGQPVRRANATRDLRVEPF